MPIDSQNTFRSILYAMSHPGVIRIVPEIIDATPFGNACSAILFTLVDSDTTVALLPPDKSKVEWLRDRLEVLVSIAREVEFCITDYKDWEWDIDDIWTGTDEAPETGMTLIVEVSSLTDGPPLIISGPGIKNKSRCSPLLSSGFLSFWEYNQRLYPCGVDLIICSKDSFLCLPRTTLIGKE